jgi:hypothetical protein
MSANHFNDLEHEVGAYAATADEPIIEEPGLSTKLARRRKIEDLFEEKRLRDELDEFG